MDLYDIETRDKADEGGSQVISYKPEDVKKMLNGYIAVPQEFWDHMPSRAHMRYLLKAQGDHIDKSDGERFRAGGWFKMHGLKEGVTQFVISKQYNGSNGDYTVSYANVERVWKKLPPNAKIELALMEGTLRKMKHEIEEIKAKMRAMHI